MALEEKNISANVYVGMRYWYPFTEEAIQQVRSTFSLFPLPSNSDGGEILNLLLTMCIIFLITCLYLQTLAMYFKHCLNFEVLNRHTEVKYWWYLLLCAADQERWDYKTCGAATVSTVLYFYNWVQYSCSPEDFQ